MDPEVWKPLADHEDILRLILCRVSWDTNLRLRSVSKAFYSMLSEPSGSTWSSMLTDTSFRTDHQGVMWVNGDIDAEYLEQSNADTVCLLSTLIGVEKEDTFEGVTYAVLNFEIHRWCKLPTLGDLPFGNLNDFTVTGMGEGLLLERLTHDDCWIHDEGGRFYFGEPESKMSEGGHGDDSLEDIYELDRFLFNPLTKGFIKLPVVPKIKGSSGLVRMIMAVENEVVTVVAVEFYEELQSRLPRILIWRQGSEDWELFKAFDTPSTIFNLPVDSTLFVEPTNAVFVGGELFLHVETNGDLRVMADGENVFSFGSRACGKDPELIWSSNDVFYDRPHLFQHEGVLKRLELEVTIELYPGCEERKFCRINLYTFDGSSRSWQEKEIIKFPATISESYFVSSKVVGVLGDILCIRRHYNGYDQPNTDVFLLYNFLTKQWCQCYAKKLADYVHPYDTFFLWSPKRHDSRQITPSVRRRFFL
ncbi:hypothetical protein R1sor_014638 [Riccia sorocarpa]|uniref:F-box domain-containing protein n=1 Tax=Riccia sorocarpa TaxID=122646 RepID=A0ABD3HDU3_9MARC